jgi:DNA polymerase (family 10)
MLLAPAKRFAERIVAELRPHCDRIEIAGSIRRGRPHVNDVDIVCIPRGIEGRERIIERCREKGHLLKNGGQYVELMYLILPGPVQLDLWFAHGGNSDLFTHAPSNWGMLLLARTGSKEHNIKLAALAKAQGLTFSPHEGIKRGDVILASETEEAIFAALGLTYIEPHDRENNPGQPRET